MTSDNFGAREISLIFGISIQTTVDEIYSNKHMDMRFIEFVEALARVADKALGNVVKNEDSISEASKGMRSSFTESFTPNQEKKPELPTTSVPMTIPEEDT